MATDCSQEGGSIHGQRTVLLASGQSIDIHHQKFPSCETLHTSTQVRSPLIPPQIFLCDTYVKDVGQYNAIFFFEISKRITDILDLQFVISQVALDLTPRYL